MKNLIPACVVVALICGCAQYSVIRQNNMAMMGLSPGMPKADFIRSMGGIREFRLTELKTVTNPYRVEQARDRQGRVVEVMWFITKVPNFVYDGTVREDDLTPFVIVDGKLDGWGWSFYRDKKQYYDVELKVR